MFYIDIVALLPRPAAKSPTQESPQV